MWQTACACVCARYRRRLTSKYLNTATAARKSKGSPSSRKQSHSRPTMSGVKCRENIVSHQSAQKHGGDSSVSWRGIGSLYGTTPFEEARTILQAS